MDIRFYGLDFKLRHILPEYAKSKVAVSTNARFDFCGDGYFELDFSDAELEALITQEPELFIEWGSFQGFTTGYNFTASTKKLFGLHLNGLLSREVIDDLTEPTAADVETLALNKLAEVQAAGRISWLTLGEATGAFSTAVSFFKDAPTAANTWVQELLAMDGAGYKISADFKDKTLTFKVLRRAENPLIISKSLKNAYDEVIDYNAKSSFNGGYYQDEESEWHYVQLDSSVSGLARRDTVLTATTEADALRELKAAKVSAVISAMTQRIAFGTDYGVGDIIRLRTDYGTVRKVVKSVLVSTEGASHIEKPEFIDVEDTE